MKNSDKTREQLLKDLEKTKKRIAELEKSETERKKTEEELKKNFKQQKLLTEISYLFTKLGKFEENMNEVLRLLGEYTKVSRVYVFEDFNNGEYTKNTYEWCNKNIEPQINNLQEVPYKIVPSWKKILIEKGMVLSSNILELPQDLIDILEPQKIKSILVLTIYVKNQFFGFMGFDECEKHRIWDKSEIELLKTVTNIISTLFERSQAEEALKESEAKLSKAQRIAKIGSWNLDLITNKLSWSDEVYRVFGFKPQQFVETYESFLENIHPEDRELVNKAYTDSLKNKEPYNIVHRLKLKDGTIKYVNERCETYYDDSGKPILSIGTIQDITERKLAELELAKHREHLEDLIKERTGEVERSQKSLVLLLEDVNEINQELENVNTMLDATNKELEAFSYSVSHDLRAPLTRMDGFSKVLLTDYSGKLDDQGIHYLNRIRASSQHMAKLIDDLLSLSRITREKISRQKVDMSQTAGKIAEELKAFEPGRKVNFEIAKGLSANADRKFVEIVLENILGNAYKFIGKKKNAIIEFGMKTIDDKKVFFIKDNGTGFNMKYYDKIFTAFQRLHSDKEFKGTGIGLAIVQRIINKHGGKIWAESKVGKGTTFYFRFE